MLNGASIDDIKMMIVEDNIDHQELIIWSMKDHNSMIDITTVETGKDCLDFVDKADFNIILLDYNLPDMNGIDILKKLRKKGCDIPIIFVTGAGDEKTAIEALRLGASDFIGKIGNYFETLPVVVQQNLDRYRVNKVKLELEKRLQEQEMQLKIFKEKLKKLSLTDSLTGLYNQRYFYDRLTEELKRSKRYEKPLSCMVMDLDYYKGINDNYGHQFGDYVLKTFAQLLKETCRETNILARYGGDEFVAILPNTDPAGAEVIADRIIKSVARYEFSNKNIAAKLTVSIGIVSFPADSASTDPEKLVELADKALYQAKTDGRNCFRSFESGVNKTSDNASFIELNNMVEHFTDEMKEKVLVFIKEFLQKSCDKKEFDFLHNGSNVSRLVSFLAKEVSMPKRDRDILDCAVLLRDIGMFGIKPELLSKKGKFTENEFAVVKKHPMMAAEIMKKVNLFKKELPVVLHHHEHYDGSGYPFGMKATKIPAGSRVIAIADAYDAMVSGRAHKKKLTPGEARRELLLNAGTQFDPGYINTFIRIVSNLH